MLISQPSFLIKPFDSKLGVNLTSQHNSSSYIHTETTNGMSSHLKTYLGISMALFSALASSIVSILIKKLTNIKAHFSILIIYAAYVGLPTSLLISLGMHLMGAQKSRYSHAMMYSAYELSCQIFYSISSALTGIVGQILLTTSFKHEDPTKIAILRSTNLFWAFLLQYIFLGIEANMFSLIGVVLIFTAILFSILAKVAEKKLSRKNEASEKSSSLIERILFFDF